MPKLLLVVFLLAGLVGAAFFFDLRLNLTSSMPMGLYRKMDKAPSLGDTVAVCLSNPVAREGLDRGYLLPGYCPSKMLPVLKLLIGTPGDSVVITNQFISVNDQHYMAPHQSGVKHFKYDNWIGQYWLYGSHNAERSWDSRYYGGVARDAIVGVYTPFFVFT